MCVCVCVCVCIYIYIYIYIYRERERERGREGERESRISLARTRKGQRHCQKQSPEFFVQQTLILSTHGSNNPIVDYNPSLEPNYRSCIINYAFLELLIRKITNGKLLKIVNKTSHLCTCTAGYCNHLIMMTERTIDESEIVTIAKQHFLYPTCRVVCRAALGSDLSVQLIARGLMFTQ